MIAGDQNSRYYYNTQILKFLKENCFGFFREKFDVALTKFNISKYAIKLEQTSIFDYEIFDQLEHAVEKYPDMRFLQLLINFGYVWDSLVEWNEESKKTYDNLWKYLNLE